MGGIFDYNCVRGKQTGLFKVGCVGAVEDNPCFGPDGIRVVTCRFFGQVNKYITSIEAEMSCGFRE